MDDDKDPDFPGPSRKRKGESVDLEIFSGPSKQSGNVKECIIHHDSVKDDDSLISPRGFNSWTTILEAAKIRQYTAILNVASSLEESEVPEIYYHRSCRRLFTMKRDLQSLAKEPAETIRESPSKFRSSRRSSIAGTSRVYDTICMFCQKKGTFKKKSHSREELIMCVDLRSDDSIRRAAVCKKDQRIHVLSLASRELVTAEAHYHFTCYRDYTRCLCLEGDTVGTHTETSMTDEEKTYDDKENEAYIMLFDMMRQELFSSPDVVRMSKLQEKLLCAMNSLGIADIKPSTKTHFRRKIETEFGSAITIFPDSKGKLLVMPDNLTIYDLAKRNQELVREIEQRKQKVVNDCELIKHAAQALRTDTKENEVVPHWPPSLEDLEGYEIKSELTKNFLMVLLTGDAKASDSSDRIQRLVNSFGQDLIYAVSVGTIKTPKYVLLPFAVKSLTGNAELIGILNRLGHGVSYSQVEEIDTALCLKKLATAEIEGAALPTNIKPYVQTTLAWDNIDSLEETLSGEGTSHRVNGIAVQPRVFGPEPKKVQVPVKRNKKRSIEPVVEELPVYNSGERVGPPTTATVEVEYFGITRKAWLKNLIWIIARQVNSRNQTVSSWTGFNILYGLGS